jgi:hypothetical protein
MSRLAFGVVSALLLFRASGARADVEPSSSEPSSSEPAAPAADQSQVEGEQRVQAQKAFAQAVELVERRDFEGARLAFLEAWRLRPHPLVAYNAALACIELGRVEEARGLLGEALAMTELLNAEQRQSLEAELAKLPKPAAQSESAPLAGETPAPTPRAPPAPPAASAQTTPPGPKVQPEPATLQHSPSAQQQNQETPPHAVAGYVSGAVGLLLASGAGAMYYWNETRYTTWTRENAALSERQAQLLARDQTPTDDAELRVRVHANDQLYDSIQAADVVGIALLGSGVVALGLSAYWLLLEGDTPPQVGFGRGVSLAFHY